ncbi:hypothetical protein GCM10011489_33780 [Gordonia jinhuaensis]|uniref:Phosphoribulokinase/uridine kinase domain-containing protein n=1 Tax=Gordonia jinhuaensis TaxID=1517702 RepID=A0A916TH44_9ACTN|nr:hypothetical protein GCM10011489_33780 [Gordonia jinhuaensis]
MSDAAGSDAAGSGEAGSDGGVTDRSGESAAGESAASSTVPSTGDAVIDAVSAGGVVDAGSSEVATAPDGSTISGLDILAARVLALAEGGRRVLVGITGSPGAGKTTLATLLCARIDEMAGPGTAVGVPMDGFHLANATLERLGRRDRKGAVDTFDGWGFLSLVQRLRLDTDHTVYAPGFDRAQGEPIAGSIAVPAATRIVVVEGNYLLYPQEPWSRLQSLLDEVWFATTPDLERLSRLVDRHVRQGKSLADARSWATDVDGANAALIEAMSERADLVVSGVDHRIVGRAPRA